MGDSGLDGLLGREVNGVEGKIVLFDRGDGCGGFFGRIVAVVGGLSIGPEGGDLLTEIVQLCLVLPEPFVPFIAIRSPLVSWKLNPCSQSNFSP